jgi:hypothetical protein
MAAFMPGASPPLVKTAIRFIGRSSFDQVTRFGKSRYAFVNQVARFAKSRHAFIAVSMPHTFGEFCALCTGFVF